MRTSLLALKADIDHLQQQLADAGALGRGPRTGPRAESAAPACSDQAESNAMVASLDRLALTYPFAQPYPAAGLLAHARPPRLGRPG